MEQDTSQQIRDRQEALWTLRERLSRDIAIAQDWTDLQMRLAVHGYTFRPAGGGLALFKIKGNRRICKASAVGPAYRQLVRRFDAEFPGHPHTNTGIMKKGKTATDLAPTFKIKAPWL